MSWVLSNPAQVKNAILSDTNVSVSVVYSGAGVSNSITINDTGIDTNLIFHLEKDANYMFSVYFLCENFSILVASCAVNTIYRRGKKLVHSHIICNNIYAQL